MKGAKHGNTRTLPLPQVRAIISKVSRETDVSENDILGDSAIAYIARARQIVYLKLHDAGCSYGAIGKLMQRDHSTIIKGVRKLREEMAA